ncbi:MAG: orotate phosphoribosyltransferase [Dehalococcoidia bacterium]|nr:orotate phosphoribosyltransferase [Dehalococcoidia bacterium]MQG09391.1 orotate phosphoribosyltransferase [SAR202 cluster bacterium]|tara:strand:- start:8826 stop:9401 length:576 start_codon:yes stop_codon:yes gene_type:complete
MVMHNTSNYAKKLYDRAIELNCLKFGDFTLSSGAKSSYYFDGRLLSLDSIGSELISESFLNILENYDVDAFGGPTIAAVPIVGSMILQCRIKDINLRGFFVRPEQKSHGAGKQIEGNITSGMKIATFDDTVSTGKSLFNAIDTMEDYGCKTLVCMTILDRNMGAKEELKKRKIPFISLWESNQKGKIKISS